MIPVFWGIASQFHNDNFWSLLTSHFALVVDVVHAVGEAPLQLRALRHVEARPEGNQFDGKLPYKRSPNLDVSEMYVSWSYYDLMCLEYLSYKVLSVSMSWSVIMWL